MKVRSLVISALCLAIGVVLPQAFHMIPNAGSILLPMHIPVLLCGLCCGPVCGLIIGILTPILSSLMTGMPSAAYLPSMIFELAAYGLITGIMIKTVKLKNDLVNTYVTLIGAMVVGRVVYGMMNALVFMAGSYSLQIWLTASFVTALPGIILQLVVIPGVMIALKKGKLIA